MQGEATVAFTHAKNNVLGAANMLRKRYADSRSPSAQLYIQLLNTHFPNEVVTFFSFCIYIVVSVNTRFFETR